MITGAEQREPTPKAQPLGYHTPAGDSDGGSGLELRAVYALLRYSPMKPTTKRNNPTAQAIGDRAIAAA